MALEACRECGKEVSTEARACPHCGFPMNEKAEDELTTTQATSKRIKMHQVKATYLTILGLAILYWGWSYAIGRHLGGLIFVAGLLYLLWVNGEKWWHHD